LLKYISILVDTKMPGKNNASAAKGKGFNKKNQFADKANKKVLGDMITEGLDKNSTRFARVTKISGNSRVLVDLVDGRINVSALIRNVLRGRAATPIGLGAIVLIGLPNWEKERDLAIANGGVLVAKPEAYIEAVIDRKTARHFIKEGLIPEGFLKEGTEGSSDEDAGFEFVDGTEETNEVITPEAEEVDPEKAAEATVAKAKWTGHGGKSTVKEIGEEGVIFNFE
jgi:hypothetical protein